MHALYAEYLPHTHSGGSDQLYHNMQALRKSEWNLDISIQSGIKTVVN